MPHQVCVFSGHLIDTPDRPSPRFPASAEPAAAAAIAAELARIARPGDLALCGGACGGDLLFAEAALRQGAAVHVYLPLPEPAFLATSVDYAAGRWHERYYAVTRDPRVELHIADEALGPLPLGADPYVRNNVWMLDQAQRLGACALTCLCLWDGNADSDGPGGTAHLVHEAQRRGFALHWLDTRTLIGPADSAPLQAGPR